MGLVLFCLKKSILLLFFFSKALGVRGQAKSIYEKEFMAIVLAIQKWRHYLICRHFIVWTDQQSLKFILEQRVIGVEYKKWVYKLLGYDFEVKFKPGSSNSAADALSRHPNLSLIQFTALLTQANIDWQVLKDEIAKHTNLQQLHSNLAAGKIGVGFSHHHGLLPYKGRLVIPSNSTLIPKLLFEFHDSAMGSHNGEHKTYLRIAEDWYWNSMRRRIFQYVRDCLIC